MYNIIPRYVILNINISNEIRLRYKGDIFFMNNRLDGNALWHSRKEI